MSTDGIQVTGVDAHPVESSVKIHGPPGCGKTTQLQERVVGLLERGYDISDICFVTYRREMAQEFLRRLYEGGHISEAEWQEPYDNDTRYFGTLHAVCNRLSNTYADVATTSDKRDFCEETYHVGFDGHDDRDAAGDTAASSAGSALFEAWQWLVENKKVGEGFESYPSYAELNEKWPFHPTPEEFDADWSAYKEENGLRDFSDMLRTVDEDGVTPPRKVVVADEYHDFTPIMHSIVNQWMNAADVRIVGGDPLQAIYTYKGATPEFFRDVDFPEVLLDRTYRVPSNVWDYARSILSDTQQPPSVTPDSSGGEVRVKEGSPQAFVRQYAGDGSVMFLARTRSQVRDVCSALREEGMIFRSQAKMGGWNESPKRLNLYNALAKLDGCSSPRGVNPHTGQTTLVKSSSGDSGSGGVRTPSSVTLEPAEVTTLLSMTRAEYFHNTKKSVEEWAKQLESEITGDELVQYVEGGFWSDMTNGHKSVDLLLSYSAADTLKTALEKDGRPYPAIGAADIPSVLTIHAAKGREADTVVVFDGVTSQISESVMADPEKRRAEDRVWYVAATRAAERLLIVRNAWDYTRDYLPDPSHVL